ncbi:MAG: nicotinate phosphoribosyltransferase, partial [Pseudomonadota bacterium]
TMPHALIGYAGDTVRAVEMVRDAFPERPIVALVDYFGREVTDALAVCRRFPDEAARGELSIRLDTPGERYLEGLNAQTSSRLLAKHAPDALSEEGEWGEEAFLIGPGVSAAAVFHLRNTLDAAGFPKVKIVCSSGFNADKCRAFARADAPVDAIGTGSFLPAAWSDTYATADVVAYDGARRVKAGREWLADADPTG